MADRLRTRPRTAIPDLGGLSLRQLAVRTWKRMDEHETMTWAAAIAFYAVLATVPSLALVLIVVVLRLPDLSGAGGRTTGLGNLTVDQLEAILRSLFPQEAYVLVRDQIARIQGEPPVGLLSLGAAIALWTASNLFLVVIDALNRTYGVTETRSFVKLRFTAMVMTLLQAACLLGSLVAIVAWPQGPPGAWLQPERGCGLAGNGRPVVRRLPDGAPELRAGLPCRSRDPASLGLGHAGEPGGTVAFLVFCFLFRLYVQIFGSYDKLYGSLGGIMVLLYWFWVVALLILGAAEMDRAIEAASPLVKSPGRGIDPRRRPRSA